MKYRGLEEYYSVLQGVIVYVYQQYIGKILSYFEDINMPLKSFQGDETKKVIYVLVFQEGSHLKDKILKLCDSF
jgi:hypothetical protein